MLKTPKVVYSCNHLIDIIQNTPVIGEKIKGSSDYDIICDNGTIHSVQNVYTFDLNDDPIFYIEGIDFVVFEYNQFQWMSSNRPALNQHFFIEFVNLVRNVKEYTLEICPRCGGNAWYVGLFENNGSIVRKMTGINKLVQDFVKILLTYKADGYGSTLLDVPGMNISNEGTLTSAVLTNIYECEDKYKQIQLSDISSGSQLSNEEKLKNIILNEIDINIDIGAIFVSITIVSEAGKASTANFSI